MGKNSTVPISSKRAEMAWGDKFLTFVSRMVKVREFSVVFALLMLCLVIGLLNPYFLQRQNIFNVLRAMSTIGIMAIGQTLIIIAGGFDLSVGSTLGMTAMLTARLLTIHQIDPWLSMLGGLVAGGLVGLTNGLIITRIGINPFVTTLGMLSIARGLTFVIAGGPSNISLRDPHISYMGWGQPWGIPFPVIEMAVLVLIGHLFLNYTVLGRQIFAVGSNERAARLSGVRVELVRLFTYTVQGFLCAVAGLITAGNLSTAATNYGSGDELRVIAAVIIGGASLGGGEGTVIGAIAGALIMAVLGNAFVLFRFPHYMQMLVIGVVIVLAVAVDQLRARLR